MSSSSKILSTVLSSSLTSGYFLFFSYIFCVSYPRHFSRTYLCLFHCRIGISQSGSDIFHFICRYFGNNGTYILRCIWISLLCLVVPSAVLLHISLHHLFFYFLFFFMYPIYWQLGCSRFLK